MLLRLPLAHLSVFVMSRMLLHSFQGYGSHDARHRSIIIITQQTREGCEEATSGKAQAVLDNDIMQL